MPATRHVHELYVQAPCEQVWSALTDPTLTERFWFRTRSTTTWSAGGRWVLEGDDGEVIAGDIVECEPPHRLVVTFSVVADPELAAERPSRVTWTIEPAGRGCRVRLVHDDFHGLTFTFAVVEAMWPKVLSGLKSVVETGEGMGLEVLSFEQRADGPLDVERAEHADWGRTTNRRVWELLDRTERSPDDDRELVAAAYASAWHWARGGTAINDQRAEWLLSRALLAVGDTAGALAHAERCWQLTEAHGFGDFDRGYALEGRYRVARELGHETEAAEWLARAEQVAAGIADPEDRDWFLADLHRS